MSKYLDKLIEDYNRRTKITSRYASLTTERFYSEEEKEDEKETKDKNIEKLDKAINKLKDKVQNLNEIISESAEEEKELLEKMDRAHRAALRFRHMSRNKIVSPIMYRKIMSYYKRHKRQKYYSKYKLDNELHNYIMRLGRYLERLDKDARRKMARDFSFDYHYYALFSATVFFSAGVNEVLGFISSATKVVAHILEITLHIVLKIFPSILKSIPFLSSLMPGFIAAFLVAFLFGMTLIVIGYSLHPDRKGILKRTIEKFKINLGIRKSRMHAAYVIYIYKLYDLLSAVASYIIKVGKLITRGKSINDEKVQKELMKKAQKSTHIVGSIDKILHFINEKSEKEVFEKVKKKMETLEEIIAVDLEGIKKLVDSIKNGNNDLSILNCNFAVSDDAIEKLADYYGDKFKSGGKWIDVTIQYTGGSYHESATPLNNVNVPSFNGKPEEISKFIGALLAISDKLAIDRIGKQEFETPLIVVDLQKLKILSYNSDTFIDKLSKPIKAIIDRLKGKKEEKLDPNTIGIKMFEAYISLNVLKSMKTEEEGGGKGKETKAEVKEE